MNEYVKLENGVPLYRIPDSDKFVDSRRISYELRKVTPTLSLKEYYDKYHKTDSEGICVTCGGPTKFRGINVGYRKHCSHYCRSIDPKYRKLNSESKRSAWSDPNSTYNSEEFRKNFGRGKSGVHFSERFNKSYAYLSLLELCFIKNCELRPEVDDLIYEPFNIEYKWDDGSIHIYKPDFLVLVSNGIKSLVEIKKSSAVDDECNKLKFKEAVEYSEINGLRFTVLTEFDLTNKGMSKYFNNLLSS